MGKRLLPRLWRGMGLGLALLAIGVAAYSLYITNLEKFVGRQETLVFGDTTFLSQSTASLRVVVCQRDSQEPIPEARVTIAATPRGGGGSQTWFTGKTNEYGTVDAQFPVPAEARGDYRLCLKVQSRFGREELDHPITVRRAAKVLLTTDKPRYQPGQTMHLRALALRRPSLTPAEGENLILQVEDPKGNRVFKRTLRVSEWGIAAADFMLAQEIHLGRYVIKATIGEAEVDKAVTVERYVLPKFKVRLDTHRPYYLPGQVVAGVVRAEYFFGKPISGGQVKVGLWTYDVQFRQFAEVQGRTDTAGTFAFESRLPEHFVGQPLEQGDALLRFDVAVTDRAEHQEQIVRTVNVAAEPIHIDVIPESGHVVPGVENIVYVVASYPDGTPARTSFTMLYQNEEVVRGETDEQGIAEVQFTPPGGSPVFEIRMRDRKGQRVKLWHKFVAEPRGGGGLVVAENGAIEPDAPASYYGPDGTIVPDYKPDTDHHLLLRPDQALYRVGDTAHWDLFTTRPQGVAYFDAIRDGQTILTKTCVIRDGYGQLDLPLTADHAGTLVGHAYVLTPEGSFIRDTRTVFVHAPRDLQVTVSANQGAGTEAPPLRPGGEAKLRFAVTNREGQPTPAAIGVDIIDESVFALEERLPGLAQTYFLLEKEILTPKYQIKYAPPAIPTLLNEQQQRAAKVWFANVDVRVSFGWAKNTEGKLYEIRMRQEVYFQRLVTILAVIGAMALIILVLVGLYRGARAANVSPCGCLVCVGLVIVIVMIFLPVYSKKGRDVYVTISERMVMEGAPATSTAPASPSPTAEATTPAEPERKAAGLGEVRLRQFFPETLFSDPAVITDAQGRADLTVPLADSITSWRLSALASSKQGELGSATHGLRVFQDFFVDLDLPVALTQGDEVSIPVAVYNYLKKPQTVRLVLAEGDGRGRKGTEGDEGRGTRDEGSESGTPRPASRVPRPADTLGTLGTLGTSDGGWFALLDSPEKTVTLEPNEVNVVYFRLKATGLGPRPLTVFAYGSEMSDAIRRWIDVRPNGKEVVQTFNGRLSGEVTQAVEIPQRAIDGASKIFVKVYPGTFSQLVEGLDALLSAPHG